MLALLAGIISKYAVWFTAGSLVVSTAALVQPTPKSTTRIIKEIVTEEKIVEKKVEVPVKEIVYKKSKPEIIYVNKEVPVEVEKIVEKIKEVPVEKIVEVPKEVIKYVDRVVSVEMPPVEKIVHIDSLETRLSSVQDKALVFLKEITKTRKKMKKAKKALVDAKEKALQVPLDAKIDVETTEEEANKFKEVFRNAHNDMIAKFEDYVPKLLNYLNSSIKLNNAFVEISHLKGSDEQTIEKYRTEAFSLRKTADEINEKLKNFEDLFFDEFLDFVQEFIKAPNLD
jgi:hypothetical protein